jgi:hypothetical protein
MKIAFNTDEDAHRFRDAYESMPRDQQKFIAGALSYEVGHEEAVRRLEAMAEEHGIDLSIEETIEEGSSMDSTALLGSMLSTHDRMSEERVQRLERAQAAAMDLAIGLILDSPRAVTVNSVLCHIDTPISQGAVMAKAKAHPSIKTKRYRNKLYFIGPKAKWR